MKTYFILSAVLFVGLGGFGCTTTKQMRTKAAALEPKVQQYRLEQQQRIDRLNREYREAFGQLMEDLRIFGETELEQWFTLGIQQNTEALLNEWEKKTLKREFRDLIARTTEVERERIQKTEQALAATRAAYADAYKDATLELAKLKKVESNLKQLSQADKISQQTLEVIKRVAEAVKKAIEEQEKKSEAKP